MPGTREVYPTSPCSPGVRAVPSEVNDVAVVEGTPAVPPSEPASSEWRYGAWSRCSSEQLVAEPVHEHHDVRRGGRELEADGGEAGVGAERRGDRGEHVTEGAPAVRRFDEAPDRLGHRRLAHPWSWVRELSASAKASSAWTASWPSAAALTRSEKSSDRSTPV